MKRSIIKDKSFAFALQAIELYKILKSEKEYIISKQFLRSATSIGANVNEALAGESRADFVHKMSIASKEARETLYWLELLEQSQMVIFDYSIYITKCTELVKILTSIVKTTRRKT
ncbi:MAG: four helix bundle protein [Chitinophagales bacterium]